MVITQDWYFCILGSSPSMPTNNYKKKQIMGLNEDFLAFTKVFDALYEIGVTKDVAIDIVINELFDNASKYAGKLDVIEEMLVEKLTIDQYISLKNYKLF